MIKTVDFTPQIIKKASLFKAARVEQWENIVEAMNNWVEKHPNISILNVETVVLPNIHDADEEGSHDTELGTGRESSSTWYQLIRLWYRD